MQSIASEVGVMLSGKERGRGRRNFKGGGGRNNFTKRSDLQCKRCGKTGTHQISVGLHGTPSKTSRTRIKMTKMLVNLLILVLLHIVILELMK